MMILTNYFNTFLGNVFKPFGSSIGNIDDSVLTWAASLGAVCNSSARFLFGKLIDTMGFKKLYSILLMMQLSNVIIAFLCVKITPIFFICVLVNFFCLGASFICMPAGCAKVFGTKWGTSVYSLVLIGSLIASVLNIPNAKLIDVTGGYFVSFLTTLIATVAALGILSSFKE